MNGPQQSQAGKRSVGAIVGGLVALGLGLAMAWFGSQEALNELLLRSNHGTVDAAVVDARIMQGRKTGTTYEIRYRFNVPGSPQTYSKRDETGRAELWTSLADEETWREAQRAGRARILYRPDDPWVNRPERAGAMPLGDTLAALILGLLIALTGLALLIFQIRGPRPAARSAAARR
jgi:hypothetical protein